MFKGKLMRYICLIIVIISPLCPEKYSLSDFTVDNLWITPPLEIGLIKALKCIFGNTKAERRSNTTSALKGRIPLWFFCFLPWCRRLFLWGQMVIFLCVQVCFFKKILSDQLLLAVCNFQAQKPYKMLPRKSFLLCGVVIFLYFF